MTDIFSSLLRRYFCARVVFFALLVQSTSFAFGGYAGGPYVVWVNLDNSSDGGRINEIIAKFVTGKSVNCDGWWKRGDSLLYMKARPPLISDDLVADIFLKKNKTQKKRLNFALKSYVDVEFHHHEGLDGVIVYATEGGAKMMSMTTGKNKIESVTVASRGNHPVKEDVEDAFCALLPPITRAP